MKTSILTLTFLTVSLLSFGQYESIEFKSDFEKKVLTNIENLSGIDALLAISVSDSENLIDEIKSRIKDLKSELVRKRFDSKTEEKKLKLLFEFTHKNFFLKYKEISNFSEIFNTKEYNCVSATALYCLILEEYDIPYVIKETPTHVYTIAYPTTRSIVLESTAPKNGYYSPSNSDIQKAVSALVDLKYYTKEEVESKGERSIYNEFFYGEDEIDLIKLAGLQYHNEAIGFLSEEEYEKALNSIYKAQLLYHSEKSEYLSYVLLASILNKSEFKEFRDIEYLSQYANLPIVEIEEISDTYRTIIGNILYKESKKEQMDSIFSFLSESIVDTLKVRSISEIHYEALSMYYSQKTDFINSFEYASKAYDLNPNNVTIQALLTHGLAQDLSRRTAGASNLKRMDEYVIQFPFLSENNLFQSLYFYSYAANAFNLFRADDITKGLELLSEMESIMKQFGEGLRYDENQYGLVYAEAGAAYFRLRNYKKAKEIIEEGLKIMPEHPELKVRLEIVLDEMN